MLHNLLVTLLTCCIFCTASIAVMLPKEWHLHGSDYFQAGVDTRSPSPIHGNRIVYLENIGFEEKKDRRFLTSREYVTGYVSQTVSAEKLEGKHFHISAYAKLSSRSNERLYDSYVKYKSKQLKKRFPTLTEDQILTNFSKINYLENSFTELSDYIMKETGSSTVDEF